MDGNALLDRLVQEISTGVDAFSASVNKLGIATRKAAYNTLDAIEQDARQQQDSPPQLSQEVWDGIINLVNIDAPEKDIKAQEAAYDNLVTPVPDWIKQEETKTKARKTSGSAD